MIRFLQPEWLALLALLPLVLIWRGRRGTVAAVEYSNITAAKVVARESKSRFGRWARFLPIAAAALIVIGLARPQLVHGRTEVEASGIDIMLAVDVSGSMQALDFKLNDQPVNRIDVVKSVVSKFIEDRPNDRIGIIAFSAAPYLVSPPTLDHDWLQQNLDRVKVAGDMGVQDGTAIGSAIASATNRLRDLPSKSKIIVLLTDGANNMGKISPPAAADAAKALGVKIYTIGAGSDGDIPMPVKDAAGNTQIVMTKSDVDVDLLKKIADTTGAKFYRATDTDSLQNIYSQINSLEKTTAKVHKFEKVKDVFAWAVVPAFALLGLGFFLEQTRLRRLP
jgi:Ca-activated chloride channel family protein